MSVNKYNKQFIPDEIGHLASNDVLVIDNNRQRKHQRGEKIFLLCVCFLEALGKTTGLTYKQISVIFNLYIQGGILLISGFIPLIAAIMAYSHISIWLWALAVILSSCYASIYSYGFYLLCKHYHLPLEYSFDLCVYDLQYLVKKIGISYCAINLIIFVLCWSICIIINLIPVCI